MPRAASSGSSAISAFSVVSTAVDGAVAVLAAARARSRSPSASRRPPPRARGRRRTARFDRDRVAVRRPRAGSASRRSGRRPRRLSARRLARASASSAWRDLSLGREVGGRGGDLGARAAPRATRSPPRGARRPAARPAPARSAPRRSPARSRSRVVRPERGAARDQHPLAVGERGEQVDGPDQDVAGLRVERDPPARRDRRQLLEVGGARRPRRLGAVDRVDPDQRAVALAAARLARRARDLVAGAQLAAPDLRGGDVDVARERARGR